MKTGLMEKLLINPTHPKSQEPLSILSHSGLKVAQHNVRLCRSSPRFGWFCLCASLFVVHSL